MSKIRIKNFGPIRRGFSENEGWLDVKKVTIFIGNQGSGKSSVAKLISTFSWIEKALTRGDFDIKWFTKNSKFRKNYCSYHRIENYFLDVNGDDKAQIGYIGDSFSMNYNNGKLSIEESETGDYQLPQIMYVPSERSFISTIKSPRLLKLSSDSLIEFLTEFDNAKLELKDSLRLPINNTNLDYDKLNDIINIQGNDYRVRLTEASSGFQSAVPLYLVSWFLANSIKNQRKSNLEPMSSDELSRFKKGVAEIWSNNNLTDDQKRVAISVLSSRFNKTAFINIVEEPEQNLFPSSQRDMLNSLLDFNNLNEDNKLIITTHSPYIITFLSIAIQAQYLKSLAKVKGKYDEQVRSKINQIVPENSMIESKDVVIYQLDETNGSIKKLDSFEGIPSDKNYLNEILKEGNLLFDGLLEIEQGL
ncbi:MAG: AAA family ATPase [Bacteroidia bacterium]